MKFFNEKQLISALITLNLFNSVSAGLFEEALNSISKSINGQQNPNGVNNHANKVYLADAPPASPINEDDFSALFGKGGLESLGLPQEAIDRAAEAAQNGDDASANGYNVSTTTSNPYGPATTTTTTTSAAEQSSTTTATTSAAEQSSTATTTSAAEQTSSTTIATSSDGQSSATTTTTSPAGQSSTTTTTTSAAEQTSSTTTTTSPAGQSSTTTSTPTSVKPYTSSTTANPTPSTTTSGAYPGPTGNPTPAPSKGIIGAVFDLIKSFVGFLWSYRVGIWNFAYNYIIKPIFDWISKKFSSGGSAYATN